MRTSLSIKSITITYIFEIFAKGVRCVQEMRPLEKILTVNENNLALLSIEDIHVDSVHKQQNWKLVNLLNSYR